MRRGARVGVGVQARVGVRVRVKVRVNVRVRVEVRARAGARGFGFGREANLLHLDGLLDDPVDVLDHLHLGRGEG